jgi:hypothetical protein
VVVTEAIPVLIGSGVRVTSGALEWKWTDTGLTAVVTFATATNSLVKVPRGDALALSMLTQP